MASFGRKRAAAKPAPELADAPTIDPEWIAARAPETTDPATDSTETERTNPTPATPARLHSVDDEW